MKIKPFYLAAALSLAGCAALDMKPLTAQQAADAHSEGNDIKGYIVYHPVIATQIITSEGKCKAETPFILGPDYSKPFSINSRSGFGKSDVSITITNGWLLASVIDKSDNSGLLPMKEIISGTISRLNERVERPQPKDIKKCSKEGIYRITLGADNKIILEPLLSFVE